MSSWQLNLDAGHPDQTARMIGPVALTKECFVIAAKGLALFGPIHTMKSTDKKATRYTFPMSTITTDQQPYLRFITIIPYVVPMTIVLYYKSHRYAYPC